MEMWASPSFAWYVIKRECRAFAVNRQTLILMLLFIVPALYAGWSADLSQLSSLGPWRPEALGLHHTTRARVRRSVRTQPTSLFLPQALPRALALLGLMRTLQC
jgi:hypothetical protein